MTDPDEALLDFESWLALMEEKLELLRSLVPDGVRARLDFSPESLEALERWLLKNYPNPAALRAPEQLDVYDGAVRYVGQTYLKTLGGDWDILLDDPDYVFHGLPIICGFSAVRDCPHSLVTAALDRRRGTFLRTILENKRKSCMEADGMQ